MIFTFRFINDTPRDEIDSPCRDLANGFSITHALPSDWNHSKPLPFPSPLPNSANPPKDFLDWINIRLPDRGEGLFAAAERKRGTNRPITVVKQDLIKLWRDNGGSVCRVFGIKGN